MTPESLPLPQMLGTPSATTLMNLTALRRIFQQTQAAAVVAAATAASQPRTLSHSQTPIAPGTTATAVATGTLGKNGTSMPAISRSSSASASSDGLERDRGDAVTPVEFDEHERDSLDGHSPPPSSSRSSSRGNNSAGSRPQRKLKIYSVEEKLDIIDYAKVIGNRAAGREYNVAESSIREWRKNESKLRTQAENARSAQPPNEERDAFYQKMHDDLVKFINDQGDVITWTMVRDKCQRLWDLDGSKFKPNSSSGNETMHLQGWVSRFINKARELGQINEIPPPVTAPNTLPNGSTTNVVTTSSASSLNLSGISMVSSNSSLDQLASTSTVPPPKRGRLSTGESGTSDAAVTFPSVKSRRKNVAPKRVMDATVKTSSIQPLDLSRRGGEVGSRKRKVSGNAENEDAILEVCC